MNPGADDGLPPAPLRVGVVGAGLISRYHLDALAALPEADVRAVVASRYSSARSRADEYGAQLALTGWEELIGEVDAAVVATPDETHAAISAGLVSAGVAVLVQKPIATSVGDAARLVRTAPAGLLSASFMHRHLDATVRLRALLQSGDLGEIMSARLRNATPGPDWGAWFFRGDHATSGVIGQLGVHGIDLVEHLLGRISTVQAMSATRMPIRTMSDGSTVRSDVPDHALAHYRLADGVLVSHEQCWAEAGGTERFRLEVHGTRATAVLESPSADIVVHERGAATRRLPIEREPVLGHRHHRAWLAAVRARQDDATARDAVRGLRIADRVAQAAASGATTDVDLPTEKDDLS